MLFLAPKGRHIYRNDKRQNTKRKRSEIWWGNMSLLTELKGFLFMCFL